MKDKKPAPVKRFCYYIPPGQSDVNGFIPSLVNENEAGHSPMTGRGEGSAPWYWGKTYEEACKNCDEYNLKMGVSPKEAMEIVASSIRAQNRSA